MNFLRRFMAGRYGTDQLGIFLLALYLALYLLSSILRVYLLSGVALLFALAALFRVLSRNCERRRAENAAFLKLVSPISRKVKLCATILRDREHRYLKCPHCGQQLRVPRGKGRINITCRSCGTSFQGKS